MDLNVFQPHIPEPCLLHHQLFRSVLIRFPCFYLHGSPSCSSPSQTMPHSHIQDAAPGPQRTGFFPVCPHQPSQFIPTPTQYPAMMALWGSFLTPVYLYILVPLSQSQGAVCQDTEGGRPALMFPPTPLGGILALCLPTALNGYTWPFMSLTIPYKLWMQEGTSAQHVLSQEPCTCCLLPGCFPRESQGFHVSTSKTVTPLAFPSEDMSWTDMSWTDMSWTDMSKGKKWILLDLMKQWCLCLYPGVLILITDPVSRVSPWDFSILSPKHWTAHG